MEYTENVLILHVGKFKEADLWVRFLSPRYGVCNAFAFGASRSRKRFGSCLDVLNHVLVHVTSAKNNRYLFLQEGTLMASPVRLRSDWQRMGLAANCIKFVESIGVGADSAQVAHSLTCDMVKLLETEADNSPLLPSLPVLFRARLAFELGYTLDVEHCALCGAPLVKEKQVLFSPQRGQFFCTKHKQIHGTAAGTPQVHSALVGQHSTDFETFFGGERANFAQTSILSHESLDAVAFMQQNSPLAWGALRLTQEEKKVWLCALDAFVQYHVGLLWQNGRFCKV